MSPRLGIILAVSDGEDLLTEDVAEMFKWETRKGCEVVVWTVSLLDCEDSETTGAVP
jgi:hypothetical protein